jgi:hypothetical protein
VFNIGRLKGKRIPRDDAPRTVVSPFRADAFNFLDDKVQREVIATLDDGRAMYPAMSASMCAASQAHDARQARLALILNVSPIDSNHFLLVPRPAAAQPQLVTRESLEDMFWVIRQSARGNLIVAFNSFAGWATVNHLHYQGYYLNTTLAPDGLYPAHRAPRKPAFVGSLFSMDFPRVYVSTLEDWPLRTLHFSGMDSRAVAGALAKQENIKTIFSIIISMKTILSSET